MCHPHIRFLLPLVLLLSSVWFASLPIEVVALGGVCGGATPCDCGDRLTESRTLIYGIDPITTTICPGHGLVGLKASLNLGGNTLQGSGGGIGVEVAVTSGITVTGGEISNFAVGIDGDDVTNSHFTDLLLTGNVLFGIAIGDSNLNVVRGNIVTMMECGRGGIFVGGGTNDISQNRVEFNRFGGREPAGIRVQNHWPSPGGNTVSRNVVRQNTGCSPTPAAGFWISDSSGMAIDPAPVQLNQSEDNDGDGFIIESFESGISVGRNVAVRNRANGFRIATVHDTFDGNRAEENGLDGVHLSGDGQRPGAQHPRPQWEERGDGERRRQPGDEPGGGGQRRGRRVADGHRQHSGSQHRHV